MSTKRKEWLESLNLFLAQKLITDVEPVLSKWFDIDLNHKVLIAGGYHFECTKNMEQFENVLDWAGTQQVSIRLHPSQISVRCGEERFIYLNSMVKEKTKVELMMIGVASVLGWGHPDIARLEGIISGEKVGAVMVGVNHEKA